jgi:hypothetical protein
MVTQSDLVPSQRFLQEVTANLVQATGLETSGRVFRAKPSQFRLVFILNRVTVQLNMSERENGQLPLAKRTIRSRISSERWGQIKVAYVSGIGLREIAPK